jgi:hypothetical protein
MCSCSGSCNCNSTTIPRGPQGPSGTNGTPATVTVGNVTPLPAGAAPTVTNSGTNPSAAVFNFGIPAGATGPTGSQGNDGINAFTTLTFGFSQPPVNTNRTITVANTLWLGEGQIIFIESDASIPTDAGGYYQVVTILTSTTVTIKRLDWTIPNTNFVSTSSLVGGNGTKVVCAGTIGAPAAIGSSIVSAKWGNFLGDGGNNDFKTSILVPLDTLTSDEDVLECQTIFRVFIEDGDDRDFFIKVSSDNTTTTGVLAVETTLDPVISPPTTEARIHMNYKIQRTSNTTFRSKAEVFLSFATILSSQLDIQSRSTFMYTTIADITLAASSGWNQNQYIVAGANDTVSPEIEVINHEVKVIKKLI